MRKTKKIKSQSSTSVRNPSKYLFKFDDCESMDGKTFHDLKQSAHKFYYEETKPADLVNEVYVWMKNNAYSSSNISDAKKDKKNNINPIIGVLCKLMRSGCPDYNEKENEYWQSLKGTNGNIKPIRDYIIPAVQSAIDNGKLIKDEIKEDTPSNVISIQDRMFEQVEPLVSKFDNIIDQFISSKRFDLKSFEPYKDIISYEPAIKLAHSTIISKYFINMLDELKAAINGECDQLVEAYSYMNKSKQKNFVLLLEKIIDACSVNKQHKKSTRKVRKPKEVSKEKLVSKVKYKERDIDLQIASVNPIELLDSSEIWIYNTKYKKIIQYIADPLIKTMSIKGTTIIGFDTVNSKQKTLRKPEEQLKEFAGLSKAKLKKFMDIIKTKDSEPNGRINQECIILKVIK